MRNQVKKIGKNTAIYGMGNVLSKLAAFFLIPIYTRYLITSDVGILVLLEILEKFLITIAPLGIIRAIWRYLPESRPNDQSRILITAFMGTVIINIVILTTIGLNYKLLGPFFGLQPDNFKLVLIVLLNIFLSLGGRFIQSIWQYQQKPFYYVILSWVQFLGILLVTILFVVVYQWGLWGVLLAKTIVLGIIFVFSGVVILFEHLSFPSLRLYLKLLRFGAPLILLAVVTPVLTLSSRGFLRLFVPLEEIGIYGIAYKFGMLINMLLVVPLQRGWIPLMYRMGIEKKSHAIYRDVLFYFATIGSVFFLIVSFFSQPLLTTIAQPEYLSGAFLIPIITFAYLINGLRQFFIAGAVMKDRTSRLAVAATVAIITNLILNYFLIRSFGIAGAAWSTLISYSVLSFLVYLTSRKLVAIDWGFLRLIKLTVVTFIIYGVVIFLKELFPQQQIIISFTGLVLFIIVLFVTRILGTKEIKGIKALVIQLKNRI
ncbi:MAG: oligosaccharide flippase family protein [FCB group bacterium]|nr:oligosaccharide flippase family protein [FCB group bacterium]